MTGEGVVEAIMTNVLVRGAEIFIAPIWLALKGKSFKKDWPWPMRIGFILMVLASCVFLEERLTQAVRAFTYSEEQAIRTWLDQLKYSHTLSSSKEDAFHFTVTDPVKFDIFKKRDSKGDVTIAAGIVVNPEIAERIGRLPESQHRLLGVELRYELLKHNLELQNFASKDFEKKTLYVYSNFALLPENSQRILSEKLHGLKGLNSVVNLVFESWKVQGKL